MYLRELQMWLEHQSIYKRKSVDCPMEDCELQNYPLRMIIHLNDDHHLSFTEIADILEQRDMNVELLLAKLKGNK